MDHQHFYRSMEGTHGSTLSHFANTMDSLDLNLHLAPPPAVDSSPPPFPFQPLASGGVPNTMFNFQQVVPTPPPQPSWARFFFDAPTTPPSPGEIDFSGYHHEFQQSPFWGMDFSDIDSGHHLDLDLSPLLQEHFREDDDELEVALIDPEEQDEEQEEQSTWWRNRSQHVPSTTGEAQLPPSSSVVATGAGSPAVAPKARQQNQSCGAKKNTSASASSGNTAEGGYAGSGEDNSKSCSCGGGKEVFFDCNVCFDVATEPVVTSCGHLFCWPCLYQWLHVHSHNDECPVCKGAVSDADVIPIYGRGGPGEGSSPSAADVPGNIPPRPRARRTDSVRQQQHGADVVLSEMLRWRAMRFMHENVERVFLAGTNTPGQRRPRRRMPERRSGIDGRPLPGPFHHGMHGGIDSAIDQHWPVSPYSDGPGPFTPQLPDPSYHLLHSSLLQRRLPL